MSETNEQDIKVEKLYGELKEKIMEYHPVLDDIATIRRAFEVARNAHIEQTRDSGEPYIIHPLHVAIILAQLKLDPDTLTAALLHDVVEDTPVMREDIRAWFGDEIAFLVDGVTKISKLPRNSSKNQLKQESFLKLMIAAAEDIRVLVIKLADRLHNMRTLNFQKEEKQESISKETLEIYAPIAQRLGISVFSMELEDLAFSYLKPEAYRNIYAQIESNDYRGKILREIDYIHQILDEANIRHELDYYQKHLFSIYRKMRNRHKTMNELYDIGIIQVVVENEKDCYLALWRLHHCYKILPGRMKDYISLPGENMYQALHTTLISKNEGQFKVHIKTKEMERFAKYGVLSYWEYVRHEEIKNKRYSVEEQHRWLRGILQWQKDTKNTAELLDLVKGDFDLFLEKIYCFTPNAEEKHLPKDSTVLDFAYSIHSEVGNQAVGAIVSGRRKGLDAPLRDGDVVQVLTREDSPGPMEEWLNFVKTGNARSNIRKWLRLHSVKPMDEKKDALRAEEDQESPYIQIAKCCLPVRGDAVIGVISSNHHYLTLHRNNCEVANKLLRQRGFREKEIQWNEVQNEEFVTNLMLLTEENSDNSWFPEVWAYLNVNQHGISRMEFWGKKQKLVLTLWINDNEKLDSLMKKLEAIDGIISVSRVQ